MLISKVKFMSELILIAFSDLMTHASVFTSCGSSVGRPKQPVGGKLDLTDTIKDGARVVATDAELRRQLLMAFTEDSRLHVREVG